MKTEFSLSDRLRYRFDNLMARGTIALLGGLGVVSLAIVLVAAAIVSLGQLAQEGGDPPGFVEAAWESLMRTLDSGTMGGDTQPQILLQLLARLLHHGESPGRAVAPTAQV